MSLNTFYVNPQPDVMLRSIMKSVRFWVGVRDGSLIATDCIKTVKRLRDQGVEMRLYASEEAIPQASKEAKADRELHEALADDYADLLDRSQRMLELVSAMSCAAPDTLIMSELREAIDDGRTALAIGVGPSGV